MIRQSLHFRALTSCRGSGSIIEIDKLDFLTQRSVGGDAVSYFTADRCIWKSAHVAFSSPRGTANKVLR